MLFRVQQYTEWELYRYFNLDHPDYPNLPPPPDPSKLKTFIVWCLNETIRQKNEENDPDAAQQQAQGRRQMRP